MICCTDGPRSATPPDINLAFTLPNSTIPFTALRCQWQRNQSSSPFTASGGSIFTDTACTVPCGTSPDTFCAQKLFDATLVLNADETFSFDVQTVHWTQNSGATAIFSRPFTGLSAVVPSCREVFSITNGTSANALCGGSGGIATFTPCTACTGI